MILKLLLVIGVIAVVYFMFIKKKPLSSSKDKSSDNDANDMVKCASCGVYSELKDSILSDGHYYCSRECVQKGMS